MAISNPLPEPELCDHCNSPEIRFAKNKIKVDKGGYYSCWICNTCGASVLCHSGTRIPMGYMTDKEGGRLRKNLHLCFDKFWQQGYMSREESYQWLALKMLKTRQQTHISLFTKQELKDAMVFCKKEFDTLTRIAERRKIKRTEKRVKGYEQERKHIARRINESAKSRR